MPVARIPCITDLVVSTRSNHAVNADAQKRRCALLLRASYGERYGDYWVLALDPDYRWALVGEPHRRYAWILARNPTLDDATRVALLTRAEELGFDRDAFASGPHTQP